MSDMPRPNPLPATTEHERHDALLVAQLAAGDALGDEQRSEAQRLVAGCAGCAALATDLRAISAAVAQEPAPARRRDFRISPEQAEQLSGNAFSRFLRGLSLPRAGAFQPLAAGVLSVGLIFVVAGYAWPDDGSVTVQAEPNTISAPDGGSVIETPMATSPPAPAAVADIAEGFAADVAEGLTDVAEGMADDSTFAEETEVYAADPEFLEALPEHQAGTSARSSQKALDNDQVERLEAADLADLADLAEAADAIELEASDGAEAPLPDAVSQGASEPKLAEAASLGEANAQEPEPAEVPMAVGDEADAAPAESSAASELTSESGGPEELLILVGLLLALTGGGLLLMGWLARRSSDPLLR